MSDNRGNKETEMEVFNRFSRIAKEHFGSGGATMSELNDQYNQPEFSVEKRTLNEMNSMGLYKGVAAGLSCFAFLRVSPGMISKILRRRAGVPTEQQGPINPFKNQRVSGYKFDTSATQEQNAQPGPVFRLARLAMDTFVSLSIGSYASLYFLDKDTMLKRFSEIPLLEGRSLLSEELCVDFTTEFKKIDSQVWDKNHPSVSGGSRRNGDGGSDLRDTIQGFVANCRRRAIFEEELRKDHGLRSNDVVVLPSPVPRDISVSLQALLGEEEIEADNEGVDGDDYFGTYFGMDEDEHN